MIDKKILIFIIFIFLAFPQQALCEEEDSSGEEQNEGLIEYITGRYNHLFEIVEFVNTKQCHDSCDLFGSSILIGIWEAQENSSGSAKVDDERNELSGRIHIMDDYPVYSKHATKVALIIGSQTVNNADRGMAPNVELYSYNTTNCYSEMVNSNVDISTHSYGTSNLSSYTVIGAISSLVFDQAIRENNVISFKSAGNSNTGDDYYTLTPPGTAKNIITVGATKGDTFSDVASFSSFGPCDDGRLKPEIVAPGYNVFLNVPGYYHSIQGTSFACPVASGSAALVLEKWKLTHSEDMLPSTMKALLVHTANNDGNGPTYRYGYGMLDTKEAVDLVELDILKTNTIIQDYSTFNTGIVSNQTIWYVDVPDNAGELKVTLAWSDKEGPSTTENRDLQNDLDLIVSRNNGASNEYYYPWVLNPDNVANPAVSITSSVYGPEIYGDHLNPLEQVQIKNPGPGNYSVMVVGDLQEGPQNYSLVITVKPKVEVYSDKEGAKVYVNNNKCYGVADGIITNGVAEVAAYPGVNSFTVKQNNWYSWLFPKTLEVTSIVSTGDLQRYHAYFNSYNLELQEGVQTISLPFDVAVSTIVPPSGADVFKYENKSFVKLSSSDTLEKGHSYLVKSNETKTVNLGASANTFEKVDFNNGFSLVGGASASCMVSDLVLNVDTKVVYKYNKTDDLFELVASNSTVNPGDALFVCSLTSTEVSV